jgi:hypothetical protein
MDALTKPRRNGRRRLRLPSFSLRTFLLVFTALASLLACIVEPVCSRQRAFRFLTRSQYKPDGFSAFDQWPWSMVPAAAQPWLEPWVSRYTVIGANRSCTPDKVYDISLFELFASEREPRDSDSPAVYRKELVAAISLFAEVERIDLAFPIDEDDLRTFSRLKHVKSLCFHTNSVTDALADLLMKMPKLEVIIIKCDSTRLQSIDPIMRLQSKAYRWVEVFGAFRPEDRARVVSQVPIAPEQHYRD